MTTSTTVCTLLSTSTLTEWDPAEGTECLHSWKGLTQEVLFVAFISIIHGWQTKNETLISNNIKGQKIAMVVLQGMQQSIVSFPNRVPQFQVYSSNRYQIWYQCSCFLVYTLPRGTHASLRSKLKFYSITDKLYLIWIRPTLGQYCTIVCERCLVLWGPAD